MRLDQEGSDNGRVLLDIHRPEVVVGRPYQFTVTYEAGPRGVGKDGCLRFKLPGFRVDRFWGKLPVRCSNPAVKLLCSNAVPSVNAKLGIEFFALDYLFVTIDGGTLAEGDTVTVAYGDTLVPQVVAPRVACRWAVEVATDLDGTQSAPGSGFYLVPDAPTISFVSDTATNIEVTIPSSTVAGEPFEASVRARDQYMNTAADYTGTIELVPDTGQAAGALSHSFRIEDGGLHVFRDVVFPTSGTNRLHAADVSNGLYARSNPSKTTASGSPMQLFWGDTHTHSNISADSAAVNSLAPPRPTKVYDYARDVANLDDADWDEIRRAASDADEPGRFVAFRALEATHQPLRRDGDRNVYFLTDDGSYVNKGSTVGMYRELQQRAGSVMVIPHQHTPTNWELHDPELGG